MENVEYVLKSVVSIVMGVSVLHAWQIIIFRQKLENANVATWQSKIVIHVYIIRSSSSPVSFVCIPMEYMIILAQSVIPLVPYAIKIRAHV